MVSHRVVGGVLATFGAVMAIGVVGFGIFWLKEAPGEMRWAGVVPLGAVVIPGLLVFAGIRLALASPARLREMRAQAVAEEADAGMTLCTYCGKARRMSEPACPGCGAT